MSESILSEYLVKLGFSTDDPSFRKLSGVMAQAERDVTVHSSGMTKAILEAQAGIIGGFTAISAAIIGTVDKVAMADQGYRLMGMQMLMTTDSARKLDMITKGLGADLGQVVWDPELHHRALLMSEDMDRMTAALGPGFEEKMRGIRDIRFEFTRLEMATKFLFMQTASDIFTKLGFKGEVMDKIDGWVTRFQDEIPQLSDELSDDLLPILTGTKDMFLATGEAMKAGGLAFTNFVGLLSGDTSIEGSEFSFHNLALAIEHVEHGLTALIRAFTDAELAAAHSAAAISELFVGNADAAAKEAGNAEKRVHWGSGAILGFGSVWAAKKALGVSRWARGLIGAGEAAAGTEAAANTVGATIGATEAAAGAGEAAAGGGALAALVPWLAAAGIGYGANWVARELSPTFKNWEDSKIDAFRNLFADSGRKALPAPAEAKPWTSGSLEPPPKYADISVLARVDPRLLEYISVMAKRYDVLPSLALAVAQQESGIRQDRTSGKGAIGVMQLMAPTAKDLKVDPFDPMQNIEGGVKYLGQLMERYHGDIAKAIAAYNAGPGRVDRAASLAQLPEETRSYVPSVMRWQKIFKDLDELNPTRALQMVQPQADQADDPRSGILRYQSAYSLQRLSDMLTPRTADDMPIALQQLQRPVLPAPQISNSHQSISISLGGIYITGAGDGDPRKIQRSVADGVRDALGKQTQFDLAQLASAWG